MANYTKSNIGSGYNTATSINTELGKIETAIASKVDEEGGVMTGDLQMNSNDILNAGQVAASTIVLNGVALTADNPINSDTTVTTTRIVATAGQTVFTVPSYSVGINAIQVFLNGVKLSVATDYAETNTTTVTLSSGASSGDVFEALIGSTVTDANNYDSALVTYTQGGTGSVATNVRAKLQETVSVKDFGAVGDGVTDDTSAIQAALDSGAGEIIFPYTSTSYQFGTTLVIPTTVRVIRGVGYPVVQPSSAGVKFTDDSNLDNLEITGLHFKGATAGTKVSTDQCIALEDCTRIYIHNNLFTETNHRAVILYGCSFCKVDNNILKDIQLGIYFDASSNCTAIGNLIDGSKDSDDEFKIGIGCLPFDGTKTPSLCTNITISNNIIKDLENSQAVLCHGGDGIVISNNQMYNCAQGVSCNRFDAGDDHFDITITGNRIYGIGSGASYTPASDVGINVATTSDDSGNIVVSGNVIKQVNQSLQNDNLGGIAIRETEGVSILNNVIEDSYGTGIVFAGGNSPRVVVMGNIIDNISGTGAHAGIKVDDPTEVTGIIKDNWITNCHRAFRIETSTEVDLIIEATNESDNTNTSAKGGSLFNGERAAADTDTTPSVKNVRILNFSNATGTNVTGFDDAVSGQVIVCRFNNANVDLVDSGTMHLNGGVNYTPGDNDTITLVYNGAEWLETARSNN